MTKKRLFLIVGLLVVVACAALGVVGVALFEDDMSISNGPGVTKANMDRIQIGMTKTEVDEIFGRPGTKSDDRDSNLREERDRVNAGLSRPLGWHDPPRGAIDIQFDRNDRVAKISHGYYNPESFMERVRRRFPWFPL